MAPKKKMKVECMECGAVFNQYYRKTHNEKQHQDLLSAHKVVRFKTSGAPDNPFIRKDRVQLEPSTPDVYSSTSGGTKHKEGYDSQTPTTSSSVSETEHAMAEAGEKGDDKESRGDDKSSESGGETRDGEDVLAVDGDDHDISPPDDIFACAAQLKNIVSFAENSREMVDKVEQLHSTSPQNILADIEKFSTSMIEKAKILKQSCNKALSNFERMTNLSEEDIHVAVIAHDPAKRPDEMTFSQKQYLIRAGPYQPKLPVFPKNTYIPEGKQRRFNPEWYTVFPHLEYSTESDSAFCFVCSLFSTGPNRCKSDQTWAKNGVRAWHRMMSVGKKKEGKLHQHFSSVAHSAALDDYFQCAIGGDIRTMMDNEARKVAVQKQYDLTRNREVITIFLDIVRTMSRLGIAFRGDTEEDSNFHQITQLISRHCGVLKKWLDDRDMRPYRVTYCSPESQNEFISILASRVRNVIIKEVQSADFFSVAADTTPDVTHQDRISCCVRYVDQDGKPNERLIEIKELTDKTGAGHAASLLESIEKNGMDSGKIVFQSYDYASSMSGNHKGAQRRLSEMLDREIPYIPCQGHRANTVVEHCCSSSVIVRSMFDTIKILYTFFSSSTKRHRLLSEKIKEVENSLLLRNLSKTRWTARAESIRAVWVSYESIIDALKEVSHSEVEKTLTRSQAHGLLTKVMRFDFLFTVMFMKNIMWKTKVMTEQMQAENLNILDALVILEGTTSTLKSLIGNELEMNDLIQAAVEYAKKNGIDPEREFTRFHRPKRPPKRIDDNPETAAVITSNQFYRGEMKHVLSVLITEFEENHKKCMDTVRPLSILFPPIKEPSKEAVQKLCELLPASCRFDADSFMSEARLFISALNKDQTEIHTLSDAAALAHKYKHILPLMDRSYRFAITAPVTVAKNERTFSRLKIVKEFIRSRCGDARLDSLMLLYCEKDLTDKIDIPQAVKDWSNLRERRIDV